MFSLVPSPGSCVVGANSNEEEAWRVWTEVVMVMAVVVVVVVRGVCAGVGSCIATVTAASHDRRAVGNFGRRVDVCQVRSQSIVCN